MKDRIAKRKICPSCSETFECLHSIECWCVAYKVSNENLEKIKSRFGDCICERCLSYYAIESKGRAF